MCLFDASHITFVLSKVGVEVVSVLPLSGQGGRGCALARAYLACGSRLSQVVRA